MVILITGASSGLGALIAQILLNLDETNVVINLDVAHHFPSNPRIKTIICDVGNARDVQKAADEVGSIDIIINNAGVNRIDFLETFTEANWDLVMDTNAKGIFLVCKLFLRHLGTGVEWKDGFGGPTILNIVSNAAHMPMTSSLAYNASKAAAHIMTLQLARELKPKFNIDVFGIAPNRLAGTLMSQDIDEQVVKTRGWTPEYAREYQLAALAAGEETDPKCLAEFIGFLLSQKKRHKYLVGTIIPYGK